MFGKEPPVDWMKEKMMRQNGNWNKNQAVNNFSNNRFEQQQVHCLHISYNDRKANNSLIQISLDTGSTEASREENHPFVRSPWIR